MKKYLIIAAGILAATTTQAAQGVHGVTCGNGSISITMKEDVDNTSSFTAISIDNTSLSLDNATSSDERNIETAMSDSLCFPTSVSVTVSGTTYNKVF